MTLQWRQVPTYETPMQVGEHTHSAWYRYLQARETGIPPAAENGVTPSASPFIYTAPRAGALIVSGGTVSAVAFSRSGTFYAAGQTSGMFHLGQGDQLKIIYTVAPTLTWVPS